MGQSPMLGTTPSGATTKIIVAVLHSVPGSNVNVVQCALVSDTDLSEDAFGSSLNKLLACAFGKTVCEEKQYNICQHLSKCTRGLKMTPSNGRPLYICIEGVDGVGKTTQCNLLSTILQNEGFRVLQTKEPGTPSIPLTMELRRYMLDQQYDKLVTGYPRECLSQAIRGIHLNQVIYPALDNPEPEYDFIIQDRGILSSFAYGVALGHDAKLLHSMANACIGARAQQLESALDIYDEIFLLVNDDASLLCVQRESRQQEFGHGDAVENMGTGFMNAVHAHMLSLQANGPITIVKTRGRSKNEIALDMCKQLVALKGVPRGTITYFKRTFWRNNNRAP